MRGAIYNGSTVTTSRKTGLFFSSPPSLISPHSLMAEIIVAGSVVIELAEKYGGKFGKKKIATGEVKAVDAATEN